MKPSIKYSGCSLIYAAILLLILPLNWLAAAMAAAAFHEICHYTAIRYTGNNAYEIILSCGSIRMKTTALSLGEELFCALAGPIGSLILFFCYPWIPKTALCAGIQGIFNLLPIYPLDGGRVFHALVHICFPEGADAICRWTEYVLLLGILLLAAYISLYYKLGAVPVILASMFLFRGGMEKFLANRGN